MAACLYVKAFGMSIFEPVHVILVFYRKFAIKVVGVLFKRVCGGGMC